MSHYSDHNKRKRLSRHPANARSQSPPYREEDYEYEASPGGGGAAAAQGPYDDEYSYADAGSHYSRSAYSHHSGAGDYDGRAGAGRGGAGGRRRPSDLRRGKGGIGSGHDTSGDQSTVASIQSHDLLSLKRDREREGRFAECGAQTHELKTDPVTGARSKEPLNVEGEVRRGRCLYCYPLPSNSRRSHYQDQVRAATHASSRSMGTGRTAPNSSTSLGGMSHMRIAVPDSARSVPSLNSAPVHGSSQSHRGGHVHATNGNSTRSMGSHASDFYGGYSNSSLGNMSPRHSTNYLSDVPDTIESGSVASDGRSGASYTGRGSLGLGGGGGGAGMSGNLSVASTTSAAAMAAEQLAIEDALTRFETEDVDLLDILSSMRRFPRSVRVQELGCEKLWIQSWEDENSSAIGRVGGIPTIIDSMRTHANSAHLQQCGCEALQNLALNDYNRVAVADCGGLHAILKAVQCFREFFLKIYVSYDDSLRVCTLVISTSPLLIFQY